MFQAAVTSREGRFWLLPMMTLPALSAGPGLIGTVAAKAEVAGTDSATIETTVTTECRAMRDANLMGR